uniref:Reverse transcriptase Ty1/copia-type domain-containing protein n=1 Tax=Tanacetum cinerariifolium TaxID=118510 RepID=A0A6L2K148_TANCI|nr:hypothetical protein [Tanacetum cinerariifolium]
MAKRSTVDLDEDNEHISTAYGVSTSSSHNSQKEGSSSYIDDRMYSFFANQSSGPQLDHENLEPIDEFDLEEMDLKWQVAMISTRLKKLYKKTRRKLHFDAKELVGFDKAKVKRSDVGNTGYKARDNEMRPIKKDEHKAMVTIDGEGVDWTSHVEDDTEDYALMAFNSNNSGSDTEVTTCSKICKESYAKIKKLYDEQREKLGVASIEIQAYTLALKEDKSGLGDVENSLVNDRFAKVEGMHVVPPLMTRNYMPSKSDFGIDESKFTYGPKQFKTSESDVNTSDLASCESNSSIETLKSVPKPVESKPKAVSEPKVWSDAPIIEEYESDSDDKYMFKALVEQEKPSCAFINTVKHVKTPRQTIKDQDVSSQNPKVPKRDWAGLMTKRLGLGYGYTRKACFVWCSFSHLIRDCDFHEKRMAKQVKLNKSKNKVTCKRNDKLVWNNVHRLNHQNKFFSTAILTKTGKFPVHAARQKFSSQAASTSTVRKVNTARPIVNEIIPRNNMYKSHSPIGRPFNRTTAPKANFAKLKVNTIGIKQLVLLGAIWKLLLKPQQVVIGDPKDITRTKCSRYITGNKAYLVEYQDFNGGLVAFGGSKGQITSKGKIIIGKLDFEDVYFVKELKHFNLFCVSQMCDKKNKVLFTDTECLVLSPDFKFSDQNQVLLRVPRQNNMYSFNLENIVPSGGLACLIAKAIVDESNKWHKRDIIEFCVSKGIKGEYSNAKTPQQNRVAEWKNITIIEDARAMLAGLFLPNTFWAEAVSTACYVLNRPVTAENGANITTGPKEANNSSGTHDNINARNSNMEDEHAQEYFILPLWSSYTTTVKISEAKNGYEKLIRITGAARASGTNYVNTMSTLVNDASTLVNTASHSRNIPILEDIYKVLRDGIFTSASYNNEGTVADFTNLESTMNMDVKSAFLYGKIDEEMYVSQLPGFIDPKFPKKVYKVVKSFYGLHQAPRAWYATLFIFLVQSGYRRGLIDKTLFINKVKKDIMLVQVYVDDIIFGSTKKSWCDKFEALIKSRFQMSSMGKLTFFLGLQTANTPIETKKPLVKDAEVDDVDVYLYKSMIGSLMYLTASRPDIRYEVCDCSRFQVTPKTSHLNVVKRIFRYFIGQPKLGLWYLRDSAFDLEAYSDSDYAGGNLDRKSIIGDSERGSATDETLSTATLAVSTVAKNYKPNLVGIVVLLCCSVTELLSWCAADKDLLLKSVKDDKVLNEFKFIKERSKG